MSTNNGTPDPTKQSPTPDDAAQTNQDGLDPEETIKQQQQSALADMNKKLHDDNLAFEKDLNQIVDSNSKQDQKDTKPPLLFKPPGFAFSTPLNKPPSQSLFLPMQPPHHEKTPSVAEVVNFINKSYHPQHIKAIAKSINIPDWPPGPQPQPTQPAQNTPAWPPYNPPPQIFNFQSQAPRPDSSKQYQDQQIPHQPLNLSTRQSNRHEPKFSPKNIAAYLSMVNSFSAEDPQFLASDYFASIERVAEMHNLTEEVALNIAKLRLRDKALNFSRKGLLLDIDNYADFKKEILARFEPSHNDSEARLRLQNAMQLIGESVSSYEQRIFLDVRAGLPRNIHPDKKKQIKDLLELQGLSSFLTGLRPELAAFVRYRGATTLSEAAALAREEAIAIENRKMKLSYINPKLSSGRGK